MTESGRPFFSIVMPVYNGMPYLTESIQSILDQTFTDWELIVADDQSTDDSARVVQELAARNPSARVRYHRKPEKVGRSPARVRNFGLTKATGEWITFLDQDDLWVTNRLELHRKAISENPDIRFFHNDEIFIDSKGVKLTQQGRIAGHKTLTPATVSGWCFETEFQGNFFGLSCVTLRKDLLDDVGVFNEEVFGTEDYDLFLRITARYPVHYIDRPLTNWRTHGNNMSRDSILMTENVIRSLRNICALDNEQVRRVKPTLAARFHFLHTVLAEKLLEAGQGDKARKQFAAAALCRPTSIGSWVRFLKAGFAPRTKVVAE